ncbi:MAG: phosphoglycerate dehydrogenase, partial [Elusimicrobia bacterium]|nr:phosphoglycerate dehydrogenase [Elusimicrobiota bacterium]
MIYILVTDPISTEGLTLLKNDPQFQIQMESQSSSKNWDGSLEKVHCWLVRSETKITEPLLSKARNLKLIGRAGVGVDNI